MCNEYDDKKKWYDEFYEETTRPIHERGDKSHNTKSFRNGSESFFDWYNRILDEITHTIRENPTKIKFTSFNDDIKFEEYMEDDSVFEFRLNAEEVYDELEEILVKKQQDYGPNNIRNAPGGPLNGLSVRLYDKMSRLKNLIESGVSPQNESLRDTFVDIANYGVIGIMILDDTFPKSKD